MLKMGYLIVGKAGIVQLFLSLQPVAIGTVVEVTERTVSWRANRSIRPVVASLAAFGSMVTVRCYIGKTVMTGPHVPRDGVASRLRRRRGIAAAVDSASVHRVSRLTICTALPAE